MQVGTVVRYSDATVAQCAAEGVNLADRIGTVISGTDFADCVTVAWSDGSEAWEAIDVLTVS